MALTTDYVGIGFYARRKPLKRRDDDCKLGQTSAQRRRDRQRRKRSRKD